MSMFLKKRRSVPGLNTSSLPDLIFTVLFFFMIVTHMRTDNPRVKYTEPRGSELSKLPNRPTVYRIFIGKEVTEGSYRIQLNDKFVSIADIEDFFVQEKERLSPSDAESITVSIKADRNVDMGVITDIKQALRRANVLKISYSAVQIEKKH